MNSGTVRLAIVGATTLKGKELADVLNERNFPARDVRLLDDEETFGQLEAVGEEINFVQTVTPEHFENVDFAFFTSDEKFTRSHWEMAQRAGCSVVDLSYALEGEMGATIRAPWVERELRTHISPDIGTAPIVVAHPAAQALALLLLRANKAAAVQTAVATILEPASERGKRGMDELHEQTVNLLSFRELPKQVFDTQVAFNIVGRYGEHSLLTLESVERRIAGHYKRIVSNKVPAPSIMVVQAPSFHAHVLSLYVELERPVAAADLTNALAGEHIEVGATADDSPSNVNVAGQEDLLVSVKRDAQRENGYWLWAAIDNLRVAGTTAVDIAESMLPTRPRGKVQ